MIVLGLTGSIAMGKSVAAAALARLGLPVHDADACVHRLMASGGAAVPALAAAFSDVVRDGAVARGELAARVFGDGAELARLEAILHPLVRLEEARFLTRCRARRRPIAVLDIPLLFETGAERRCDYVVLVSAPAFLQTQRALARTAMSAARLTAIRARQMPEPEKRRCADFVVPSGLSPRYSLRCLRIILGRLTGPTPPPPRGSHA